MKAVFIAGAGSPVEIRERPEPSLRPEAVIVRVLAAPVLSFQKAVLSGKNPAYLQPFPYVPGANGIGIVESVGEEVVGIMAGQMVFINPLIRSATTTGVSDGILLGLTALGPHSGKQQDKWRDGTFAEKVLVPGSALTVLEGFESMDAAKLSVALSFGAIPFGGLLHCGLSPGQTMIVVGATGNLGALGVLVALALGAASVVAVGRDRVILERVRAFDPSRVRTLALNSDLDADTRAIRAQVGEGADGLLDIIGDAPTAWATIASIRGLRPGGTAVLMGSSQADVSLPYLEIMLREITLRGKFMYPPEVPAHLAKLIRSGLFPLAPLGVRTFTLDEVGDALDAAEAGKGPDYTVLMPSGGLSAVTTRNA